MGDGEFDGIQLLAKMAGYGWSYVCRTAKDTILTQNDEMLTFENLAVSPGTCILAKTQWTVTTATTDILSWY